MAPPKNIAEVEKTTVVLGLVMRLLAVAALGFMFMFVKLAAAEGVHVVESLFWRQLAGLPAVLLWLWLVGGLGDLRTRRPSMHAVRMTLGIISMLLNYWAMTLLPMAEASTISFAVPIFATLLAAILLGEPTGRFRWAAIILGFAGVIVAVQPGSGAINSFGSIVALTGALGTAAVTIQIRHMSFTESAGAIVFWFSLISMLPLGIAMFFFAAPHEGIAIWYIAGLSIAGAIAQIFLTLALKFAPVAAALSMDYTALIWSVALGYFIFSDVPGISVFIGAPIIIAAGLIIMWREHYLAAQRGKAASNAP